MSNPKSKRRPRSNHRKTTEVPLPTAAAIEATLAEITAKTPSLTETKTRYTVTLYPEIHEAVRNRVSQLGTISLTEYVNRAVAKILRVSVKIPFHNRPFKPKNRFDPVQATDSIFGLLSLTPIGTPSNE